MSNRRGNFVRLQAAAEIATTADKWVSSPKRALKFSELCQDYVDDANVARLCEQPRMVKRLGNDIGMLFALCTANPRFAPWLKSAGNLRRLSRLTGAVIASGALSQLVGKSELNKVAQTIGYDVARIALEKPSGQLPVASSADDLIAFIESEGEQAVGEYITNTAPSIAAGVMCAAGLTYAPRADSNARVRASALANVIERVTV